MKSLIDYKDDIYKCTKCGLCQAKCPIFKATGLETAVSRGKFTLLDGLLNCEISNDKNLMKYFDLCLNCRACEEFCPSGIKAEDIIILARHHYFKKFGLPAKKKLLLSFLNSKKLLKTSRILLNSYRFLKLNKILNFNKRFKIFNSFITEEIKYKKTKALKETKSAKIVYFTGCIENYINKSIKNSVEIVLQKNNYTYEIPEFNCCSIANRNAGDIDTYIKTAKKNLDLIDENIDYLLFSCPSCMSAFLDYEKYLDADYLEKFEKIKNKIIDINKFIIDQNIFVPNAKIKAKTTYHDSCHLKRSLDIYEEPRTILKELSNYAEMEDADVCCGAAGSFCFTHPEISKDISKIKAKNIQNSEAQIVSASCISCRMGLLQGIINNDQKQKVLSPVEILAKSYLR